MPAAAATKILARGFKFEINTGTDAVPVWVAIGGVNTFSFDSSKADADTTDFDSNGRNEHMVASRTFSMTLGGHRKEDLSDGTRDLGQEAVEAAADDIGPDSLHGFRFYNETSLKGKQFKASVNVTGPGGGNDDVASWNVDLTGSGAVTSITVVP
jgi:hypothetical protein